MTNWDIDDDYVIGILNSFQKDVIYQTRTNHFEVRIDGENPNSQRFFDQMKSHMRPYDALKIDSLTKMDKKTLYKFNNFLADTVPKRINDFVLSRGVVRDEVAINNFNAIEDGLCCTLPIVKQKINFHMFHLDDKSLKLILERSHECGVLQLVNCTIDVTEEFHLDP